MRLAQDQYIETWLYPKCNLVSCVLPKSTAHHEGSPSPTKDKLSIQDFARLICEMSRGTDAVAIAAPLIFNGGSTPVFRVALTYMRKYVPQDSTQSSKRFLQESFIIATNHLHINNIPWHGAAGLRGRRRRKPVFDSWVNLGKAIDSQAIECHHTQLNNAAAGASQRAQVADTRAAWDVQSWVSTPFSMLFSILFSTLCGKRVGFDDLLVSFGINGTDSEIRCYPIAERLVIRVVWLPMTTTRELLETRLAAAQNSAMAKASKSRPKSRASPAATDTKENLDPREAAGTGTADKRRTILSRIKVSNVHNILSI
ncbi:hypothetical protein F4604DRAFT_1934022 [Suillus subluteus]|nr:hypothetical protein F4604DRAFT_1934022 [Suillus subluteus]